MTAEPRRRWATLTTQQLAIAEDLRVRAERLMAADQDLTAPEAVDIAAIEGGYQPITKPYSPVAPDPGPQSDNRFATP